MNKIAVITEGNIYNRLGQMNAVHNRVTHLRKIADYGIDVFMIQVYDGWLTALLRHSKAIKKRPEKVEIDGVEYNMLWFKRSLGDMVRHKLLHRKPKKFLEFLVKSAAHLDGYDLISAHSRIGGITALVASKKYNIQFFMTWHGSDIHTDPYREADLMNVTHNLLHEATCNFMVSKALAEKAKEIDSEMVSEVLYNGVSDEFHRLDDEQRKEARREHGVSDEKVVAYVGRFNAIKNVTLLPEIFKAVGEKSDGKVKFWAIGDGELLSTVENAMQGVDCRFWGLQPAERMPMMMNCIDVLVLPSKMEGLPLVAVEAMACGANVAATRVGGTPEAVGADNTFKLDSKLAGRISTRIVEMLDGKVEQQVPAMMSWEKTAEKENSIYKDFLA
jgi:teichuronic acid biosynthesis glycosyltransferase TuaC